MTGSTDLRSRGSRLVEMWRRQRFTVLLLTLVINILVAPVIGAIEAPGHSNLGAGVMLLSSTGLVVAALLAASGGKMARRTIQSVGFATVVLVWLDFVTDEPALFELAKAVEVVFLALVIVLLVRHVFGERRVTLDAINASLCAYLMVGLAWAACFALIEIWQPGSFHLPEDGFGRFSGQGIDASVRHVYFIFVTLLTLGYGEIVPVGSIARMSAVMEAFVGQAFLVVLIARLVGVHVGQTMLNLPPTDGSDRTGRK